MIRASSKILACDYELLSRDATEWSKAHSLPVYLEQELPRRHVDCEYNRQGQDDDVKRDSNGEPVRSDIASTIEAKFGIPIIYTSQYRALVTEKAASWLSKHFTYWWLEQNNHDRTLIDTDRL